MSDAPPTDVAALADVLTGPGAGALLETAVARTGGHLRSWGVRAVHRRGATSLAVVHRVALTDGAGQERDRLWVLHASARPVPPGALTLDVDGARVHAWAFPHDPYLPGLPGAVSVAAGTRLLRDLGHGTDRPGIRTRSYRPTRRAVVELRRAPAAPPAAYVKLLGGRRPDQVRTRTARLVAVHDTLGAAGVPVPTVLHDDGSLGRVVLAAVPGERLRTRLRSGDPPPVAALTEVLTRLHASPGLPDGADPDAFADATRHLDLLGARCPWRAADLARLRDGVSEVAGPVATIHGDLHDGQLLLEGGEVTGLLDVDQAGTGHVAHDLGRLLAGIEASAAAADDDGVGARSLLTALHGWSLDRCDARSLAAATAGAWVGLATGPVRVASPTWRREVDERLDRALAWLDRLG